MIRESAFGRIGWRKYRNRWINFNFTHHFNANFCRIIIFLKLCIIFQPTFVFYSSINWSSIDESWWWINNILKWWLVGFHNIPLDTDFFLENYLASLIVSRKCLFCFGFRFVPHSFWQLWLSIAIWVSAIQE